ncbi:hypothetical protein EDB81DRAFT_780344 [Dactylonectria macrodidyma]|uniref:Uncharacterized protein n=1 Tax=Dactylonectria macrodidyma TaxID=307937 RepID=A0A9P9JMN4_9HYPO|nr:hypothetical protein EDB81DRAFT_780344 [Dactylonectria macrodidyma]
MALSKEAIVAIIGVLINVPAAALILWKLWRNYRSEAFRPSLEDGALDEVDDQHLSVLTSRNPTVGTISNRYTINPAPHGSYRTLPSQRLPSGLHISIYPTW